MNTFAGPFLLLAGLGFLLSLTAHVLALLGKPCPGGGLVWLLHLGVFAVWVPTIILSRRRLRDVSQTKQMEALWADCPAWMRWAIRTVFVYAIVNFLLFMATTTATPKLKPRGTPPPAVIRGFSGHWMVFYGAAFVTLYSRVRKFGQVAKR